MELSGREGFTTFTIGVANMSIIRTTMLPSPCAQLMGVDPANQLLLCGNNWADTNSVWWVTETDGVIQSSLDGGRSSGNIVSAGYDGVTGHVLMYDESAGVLFNVDRNNTIVSQVSNTEHRGTIIAMDVDAGGQFVHALWIRGNDSDVSWYECVQVHAART